MSQTQAFGSAKIWGEWLAPGTQDPFPRTENRLIFGRLGSAIGLHKVLIPLNPPAF
jgi:hypothetical protein